MADEKPEPIPRKSPKKRSGPSMREQIAARRKIEQEGGAGAEAPKAAPKKAAPKASRPAAAAKPKAAATPRRAAAGGASRRSREGGEEAGGARRARRERPEKKSSPLPMIAAGVVLLGGGGAAAYFGGLFGGGDVEASETQGAETGEMAAADGAAEAATEESAEGNAEASDADMAAKGEAGEAAGGEEPAAEEKPAEPKKKTKLTHYSTDELKEMRAALEPFPKPDTISQEEWDELGKKADMLFVDAGRKSSQAEKDLSIDGKKEIYPLIINRYVAMDFEDEEAVMGGKLAARVLTAVRGSTNNMDIGWRTAGESEDGTFGDKELRQDLMIVINSHKSWSKVVKDPAHWERIYLGDQYKESKEILKASAEAKLEELDDLDVDDLDLDDLDG